MADLKVSNPTFVINQKLTKKSFIRHVKAESQCHPKTPFNKGQGFFFGNQKSSEKPSTAKSIEENKDDEGTTTHHKLISLRKMSQDSDENSNNFLRPPASAVKDAAVPMRIASQQHKITNRLFDNLGADNNSSGLNPSSNDNAIDNLNLLEDEDEDDESEAD